ncbi:PIG-L deacetylase family protein [Aporhodopirellula aestuarii]|uniref:PIG-L family deacetylase n=1 Tax=Aporhodopirellula aestuarii TaxID=2950107 RepID=A0ABT0UEG2_9BACT|nr:PIG-L deacetylase family protein [Aporhodopirellula aestuarii]MCM2375152.1 PIG-L family deacetylase [Aporhodopirellula aestuarii]
MNFQLSDNVESVLCLGAHADDIEIGCGATLASLVDARPNLHVDWVVLSGDSTRREEAEQSAHCYLEKLESSNVEVHAFRDSYFPGQYVEIKEFLHSLAKRTQPDLIFTHRIEDRHQDHRTIGELTWNVFRGPTILEYEIPKFEGDLLGANVIVPCSEEDCQRKVSRLMEHFDSQKQRSWFDVDVFRGHMRLRGIEGACDLQFAEAFWLRKATFSLT